MNVLERLGLRLRVLLLFAALGLGSIAAVLLGLWFGHARAAGSDPANGFVVAGIVSALAILGLTAGIWLLFDENVAKPVERLAAWLRLSAHAEASSERPAIGARYLGDLAPAAEAVARRLGSEAASAEDRIASETASLGIERDRLGAILSEIPVAILMVGADDRIALYDGQAAEVLGQVAPPRLNAPLSAYFRMPAVEAAKARMQEGGRAVDLELCTRDGSLRIDARMRALDDGGYLLVAEHASPKLAPGAARPLVYEFALPAETANARFEDRPLRSLSYTVLDLETTGLLPHADAIVQIGAVRVLCGRIVKGEEIDMLVDPGRPIPASATAVHGIADRDVAGAPPVIVAARRLHAFCEDAVVVAHNAPFDLGFLKRQTERAGLDWSLPVLDTVFLSAIVFGASEVHTLDALAERLGIAIPQSARHSAIGDARVTAEALLRLLPILEARGLDTFSAVVAESRRHRRMLEELN